MQYYNLHSDTEWDGVESGIDMDYVCMNNHIDGCVRIHVVLNRMRALI